MALIALVVAACAPDPQDSGPQGYGARQATFTDGELRAAVYSDYAGPAGMYSDPARPLYYVNTVSTGQSDSEWRELCTDDYAQAKEWVDASDGALPNVTERQEERFFEFVRDKGSYRLHFRAHRCAYFDPYVYDHFNRGPERGVFNQRPLTGEAVADLGEYLWYLSNHQTKGFKVLSSFADETDTSIQHSMYYTAVVYGDFGLCDTIFLKFGASTVDRATGGVIESNQTIRTVQGHCH
jgi:hypothetical protein